MRSTTTVITQMSDEVVKETLGNILTGSGYVFTRYKGMQVWKKGNGWLTAPQIFKIDKTGDQIIIESWIPFAILPGVYLGESGLESGFGFAVKIPMRKILKDMIYQIIAPGTEASGYLPK